jgi:hypothetical protein
MEQQFVALQEAADQSRYRLATVSDLQDAGQGAAAEPPVGTLAALRPWERRRHRQQHGIARFHTGSFP